MQLATIEKQQNTSNALLERVEYLADRLGPTDLNVLISGEPGVGKVRLAGRLFRRSKRRLEPLIRIHCSNVSPGFLGDCVDETSIELNRRLNHPEDTFGPPFRATLILEEIGDLEPGAQAALFRLAEERETQRLHGRSAGVDVRLVATSSVDLREASDRGRFRKDLLYRLNVGHLNVPPLRDRTAEIPRLLTRLLHKYARHFTSASGVHLTSSQWQLLRSYSWPRNDDEMEDFVKSLVGLRDVETAFELLQQKIRLEHKASHPLGSMQALSRLARQRAERRLIEGVLEQTQGDFQRAASILDISPALLLDKIQELKLAIDPGPPVRYPAMSQAGA